MFVNVSWMIRRDVRAVLDIEQESAECPWNEEKLVCFLRGLAHIGMVADDGNQVVGYMVYKTCGDIIHVPKLAVHPNYRRNHVGSQMVSMLINKIQKPNAKRTRITINTSEYNLAAQLFLRNQGFKAVRVVRGEPDIYSFEYRLQ